MDTIIRRGFSVRQSKDSEVQKQVILELDTTGATEEGILELALKQVIIDQQRALRTPKAWKELKDGGVVRANLVDHLPKGTRVDPMAYIRAKLEQAETQEDKIKILKDMGIDL